MQNDLSPELKDRLASISQRKIIVIALMILLALVLIGSIFYHFIEGWNWLDSTYFCVVTLATVGYGDFTPHTPAGKIFTMGYIFFGIGLFVAVANLVLRSRLNKRGEKFVERHEQKKGSESA